jgi:hypothetical protein
VVQELLAGNMLAGKMLAVEQGVGKVVQVQDLLAGSMLAGKMLVVEQGVGKLARELLAENMLAVGES